MFGLTRTGELKSKSTPVVGSGVVKNVERPPGKPKQPGKSSVRKTGADPLRSHHQRSSFSTGVMKKPCSTLAAGSDTKNSGPHFSEGSSLSSSTKDSEVIDYKFGGAPCMDPSAHLTGSRTPANEFFMQRSWFKGPSDPSGTVVNLSDRPSLCMSVHGNEVAVASSDHAVYTVDAETCKLSRILYGKSYGHTEWVTCVDHVPDGRIISGGMDNKLCLWDKHGVRSRDLKGHSASVSAVKAGMFKQADFIAVSASYDKSLILWNLGGALGKEAGRLVGHKEAVMDFATSSKGRLISGSREGSIILWDINNGLPLLHCRNAHKGQVSALTSIEDSAGGEVFLTGGQDGVLHVWDFRFKKPVHSVTLHRSAKGVGALSCIGVTQGTACGCPLVATAGADRLVKVLDVRATFRVVHTLQEHKDFIYSLYVKGSLAWSGGGDGSLLVHDLVSGKCLYGVGATDKGAVRGISLAGEGEDKLIVTGDDGNVMIYSL